MTIAGKVSNMIKESRGVSTAIKITPAINITTCLRNSARVIEKALCNCSTSGYPIAMWHLRLFPRIIWIDSWSCKNTILLPESYYTYDAQA